MGWHCDPCGKDLSSYKNLWRHKKTCKATQRCPEIIPSNDQTYTPRRLPGEKIYKQLGTSETRQPEDESEGMSEGEPTEFLPEWTNEGTAVSDGSENEEDKQMDSKIWNAIANWCRKSDKDALVGFKFWFEFCQELKDDPTIEKILETVKVYRDEHSLGFKEALDLALMKRKYLIYETLKAFKTKGIWKILLEEPDNGLDVFQLLKKYILACKSMNRDPIFISVREMVEDSMVAEDEMDHNEALNNAIESKADEIFEAVGELPRRDTPGHVWNRIGKTFNPLSSDVFLEVRYFVNMQLLIEDDTTFQTVLSKINEYLDNGQTLDAALYNAVKEEEPIIHESFARGGELWDAMKADEFGDEKEEPEIFKTYVLYHLALNRDELFQSIMDNIQSLTQDGWKYKDALNYTIQQKKVDIRNVIGHPWVPGLRYL